ncbi:helix-turn-helix domain-containing protein [Roseateles sp. L2-2]|uniref:helix-turn-helix domain-containing protein n=1 Tax=Roseateles sp. L2-2 TaxID=3422597 RepID=UPI003D364261
MARRPRRDAGRGVFLYWPEQETDIAIQRFSTRAELATESARLFEHEMACLFSVGLSLQSEDRQPLVTDVLAYRGRRLQFASLQFTPHHTSAGVRTSTAPPRWLVTLQKAGEGEVSQAGRTRRVGPGDMFLLNLGEPFHIETGHITTHSVYLDAAMLRRAVPDAAGMTAMPIATDEGPGAVFRAVSDEMFALAPSLTEHTADRLADALPFALGVALSGRAAEVTAAPSRLQVFHRERVRAFVVEHLHEPELDVDAIAQGVKLSPRYLYQLFGGEGVSLMKWVWAERLERCRQDLSATTLLNRSIGSVAYSWGFSDVAHFSRAFKDRFGETPSGFRKRQR